MYRTGKTCEEQGYYRSNDCGYELEVFEKEDFPRCPLHGRDVTWTLVKETAPVRKKRGTPGRR